MIKRIIKGIAKISFTVVSGLFRVLFTVIKGFFRFLGKAIVLFIKLLPSIFVTVIEGDLAKQRAVTRSLHTGLSSDPTQEDYDAVKNNWLG
ncbi:MAG: hypothetical protein COB50_05270 [Thiotrichales bacterium]|nr:MAG: hypothetical protein COB50_05270 [Thiotrichales bacterium]